VQGVVVCPRMGSLECHLTETCDGQRVGCHIVSNIAWSVHVHTIGI